MMTEDSLLQRIAESAECGTCGRISCGGIGLLALLYANADTGIREGVPYGWQPPLLFVKLFCNDAGGAGNRFYCGDIGMWSME